MKTKQKEFIVYRIYHVESGKSYIGITGDYKKRMKEHFRNKDNCYLHKSIQKHGKDKFITEIIFKCDSWKEVKREEIDYIKVFNTKAPNGYNLTEGGEGVLGHKHSEKTLQKMSEVHKNQSIETRKKRSEIRKSFSSNQIIKIKQMLMNGVFQKDIAKKFNVHQTTISDIKTGRYYSEIQHLNINNLPKGKRKFTNNQILEIRQLLSNEILQCEIAEKFDVLVSSISQIKRNKIYKDVQLPKE